MSQVSQQRSDSHSALGASLFEHALPEELFDRLVRAVNVVGDERLPRNYKTTFWIGKDQMPRNVAEEAALHLATLARPHESYNGIEWWLGRLQYGQKLRFHFDRDMTIQKKTGRYVHPLLASVLYLNDYPTSPTVVVDQVPASDGKGRVPAKPTVRESIPAVANRYLVFPGNLRHGVKPSVPEPDPASTPVHPLRLSLLVNFWQQRPKPPICFNYDGTIYPALMDHPDATRSRGE